MVVRQAPKRMCVACKGLFDKSALLRVVRTPENEIRLDRTGKMAGRGAYLCTDPACFAKCLKNKILNKAFRMNVSEENYSRLREEYEQE